MVTKSIKSASPKKHGIANKSGTGAGTTGKALNEGKLALDVYQTATHIHIIAPIAGVKLQDINVSVTEDVLNIKGKRALNLEIPDEDYFTKECFWGNFSRSIILPSAVDSTKIVASFKDGVLKVSVPKTQRTTTKVVRIKSE